MSYFLEIVDSDGIFVVRLLVAMVLGGLVGMERQRRGRAAGFRTNILVCLGSAAIIVAFQKLSLEFNLGADSAIRMDPARAASGVITGIGFLGAGTIVKSKDFVLGLTTAASIWVVSAIGVIIGLGEYVIGVVLTLLVLFSLYGLHYFPINADCNLSLHLTWHGELGILDEVEGQLLDDRVCIKGRSVMRQPNTGKCKVVLVLCLRSSDDDNATISRLQADPRFDEVAWG